MKFWLGGGMQVTLCLDNTAFFSSIKINSKQYTNIRFVAFVVTECNEAFSGNQPREYWINLHFRDCLHDDGVTISKTLEMTSILTWLTAWGDFIA